MNANKFLAIGRRNRAIKKVKFLEAALVVAIFVVIISAFSQTWTQSSATRSYNEFIVCSADGKVIMAVTSEEGARPAISTDWGLTWNTNSSWPDFKPCAAMSADGTMLIMPSYSYDTSGYIYVSPNMGTNWYQTSPPLGNWMAVACSPDGTKLLAGIYGGAIWISTNSGYIWNVSSSAGNSSWTSIATSADGNKLAASGSGVIYVSTNAGQVWRATSGRGSSVATTPSGGVLAATGNGSTYISTNFGATWRTTTINGSTANGASGNSIALSADGKYMAIADFNSKIYTSTNSGVTWVTNNVLSDWFGIASSADGHRLVASSDGNKIWLGQMKPSPQLNLAPAKTNLTLSWIIPSTNFVLQQNPDLTTTNWSVVTNPPVLNLTNLQNQVTLPLPAGNGFYRLKTP